MKEGSRRRSKVMVEVKWERGAVWSDEAPAAW
jgi:hypothetical protein